MFSKHQIILLEYFVGNNNVQNILKENQDSLWLISSNANNNYKRYIFSEDILNQLQQKVNEYKIQQTPTIFAKNNKRDLDWKEKLNKTSYVNIAIISWILLNRVSFLTENLVGTGLVFIGLRTVNSMG